MLRRNWCRLPLVFLVASSIMATGKSNFQAAEKIRFGTPVKIDPVIYLPILAAEENGIWKKYDINAEWIPFQGGGALYRSVAAGSIDMGIGASLAAMQAAGRGVPVVVVAETVQTQPFFVWVLTGSHFKEPKDLKGARVGVPTLGGSSHAFGLVIVRTLGIEKDVKFIGAGGLREELAALQTGKIDAIVEPITVPIELKIKGAVRELASTDKYLPKEWLAHVQFAHRQFMEKNPETVRMAVKAIIEAADFIRNNQKWAVEKMKSMSGYSEEAARIVYQQLEFSRDGKINKKAVENVLSFMFQYGILPKEGAPPIDTLYTQEFTG